MARLNLSQIVDAIRFCIGAQDESRDNNLPDAATSTREWALRVQVQEYVRSIRARALHRLQQEGISLVDRRPLKEGKTPVFEFWRTIGGSVSTTAGSATAWLPADYDLGARIYDGDGEALLGPVRDDRRWRGQRGNPVAWLDGGLASNGGTWQRRIHLRPQPRAAHAPSLSADYWRLPAEMTLTTPNAAYPDLPEQFCELPIFGVGADVLRTKGPSEAHAELMRQENRLFQALLREASWV